MTFDEMPVVNRVHAAGFGWSDTLSPAAFLLSLSRPPPPPHSLLSD